MSNHRSRQNMDAENGQRARTTLAKAAGDAENNVNSVPFVNQNSRVKSKNKLPKSVRYDLENALVGLCDVWFENIKPHLIRNNIKLHVDDGFAVAEASGDHKQMLPVASGCAHLDPGAVLDPRCLMNANYVGFCPTRPTASKAPSLKPQASRSPPHRRIRSPLSPVTEIHSSIQNSHRSNEKKSQERKRRKAGPSQVLSKPNWRVPRLCRTYSLLVPNLMLKNQRRTRTALPTQFWTPKPYTHYSVTQKGKRLFKNKLTQTEWFLENKTNPTHRASPVLMRLPESRCVGTATALVSHTRHDMKDKGKKCSSFRNDDGHGLFKSDVIYNIKEKNDKRLKLLFRSPRREPYPSIMNLASSSCASKEICTKKLNSWR